MRNIFELTKSEQRIVIAIVTILVAIAFGKHAWQSKSRPPLKISTPTETPSARHEGNESSESCDQFPDKSGKRP
ncbi:MAG TPA: hypothetical protein VMO75_06345 [Chthoniobacterales bacterium]|nr:hypothetical protein [Chthoniobacterales bacterium]